jgi:hypothetical protein
MKDDPATFSVINKQLITMIKDFNEWKYKNNLTYITGIVTNISLVFCNFKISNLNINVASLRIMCISINIIKNRKKIEIGTLKNQDR